MFKTFYLRKRTENFLTEIYFMPSHFLAFIQESKEFKMTQAFFSRTFFSFLNLIEKNEKKTFSRYFKASMKTRNFNKNETFGGIQKL
jgi:hypothetical protein